VNGYALTVNGVYKSTVVNSQTGQISAVLLAPQQCSGVQDQTGYYAHGIAANTQCVVFSATNGVHFAQDVAGGGQSGLLVPAMAPILGVAIGPDGNTGFSALYYTVYAPGSQGGGVYKAPLPTICGGSGGGTGGGGGGMDASATDSGGACMPKSCVQQGFQCGVGPDGCGGTVDCGPTCPVATPNCIANKCQ
jgi:hypothetical protein